MNELPDPLLEILKPQMPGDVAELRQRLREQTSRHVRRRFITRQLAWAASLAAGLLAFATAVYVFNRLPDQPPHEVPPVVVAPKAIEQPVEEVSDPASPVTLEWRAFDSQTNRAAAYFLAGNKYLEANEDMESALRCYVQALDACNAEQLEVTSDDNWLVVSLKNARRKELVHD